MRQVSRNEEEHQMAKAEMTNRKFAETNKHFKECCLKAEVEATMRQASKFRRGIGAAYAAKGGK